MAAAERTIMDQRSRGGAVTSRMSACRGVPVRESIKRKRLFAVRGAGKRRRPEIFKKKAPTRGGRHSREQTIVAVGSLGECGTERWRLRRGVSSLPLQFRVV